VVDGSTGLHFTPGDAEDLAAKIDWAWHHPAELQRLGREARAEFERRYTAERNLQMLEQVYAIAIERVERRRATRERGASGLAG
jgi:glycosyltransferase involved in cell wall biosynthesis